MAYIEFALTLPFLMLFTAGVIDMTRMLLLHQKVDKAVFTMGDLVTQQQTQDRACAPIPGWSDTVIRDTLRPFVYNPANFRLRVSSVLGTGPVGDAAGDPLRNRLEWRWPDLGQVNYTSVLANNANFPLDLQRNERVIMTEMFYRFQPLLPFWSGLTAGEFRKVSFMAPRATVGGSTQNAQFWGTGPWVPGGTLSMCGPA